MSNDIRYRMEEMHKRLQELISQNNYNLLDENVISYSQELDLLIVEYIKSVY